MTGANPVPAATSTACATVSREPIRQPARKSMTRRASRPAAAAPRAVSQSSQMASSPPGRSIPAAARRYPAGSGPCTNASIEKARSWSRRSGGGEPKSPSRTRTRSASPALATSGPASAAWVPLIVSPSAMRSGRRPAR